MVDKRSLRSSKPDSTPSTNGDKVKSNPQTSNTGPQAKSQPARTTSTKAKTATGKKEALNSAGKEMGDDKQQVNGTDPVENGVSTNGVSEDVEMEDDGADAGPKPNGMPKKSKDGEDEMTVVVPPPKSSKLSGDIGKDQDRDVEMANSVNEDKETEAKPKDPAAKTISGMCHSHLLAAHCSVFITNLRCLIDIKSNFELLGKAVSLFDARFSLRALRSISSIRKRLSPEILAKVITETYLSSSPVLKLLLEAIGQSHISVERAGSEMEIDGDSKSAWVSTKPAASKEIPPEVDVYLSLLVQAVLFDTKAYEAGAKFSLGLVQRIHSLNRRTLDTLAAKAYFYLALFYEQLHPLPPSPISPVISIRQELLCALRTAVLRKDTDIQAITIVLLLRNYLSTSHISQADLLIKHTEFPVAASNNQVARYLYYLGKIRAVQLSYSEAHEHLIGATRKSPTSPSAAGFYQSSMKLLIVVELLMGDIPDRAIFRQPNLERALKPYFLLVQAVRVGNLEAFLSTVQKNIATFRKDGTYTLILRLRQNVIKTGIRMMSLSYSRISLRDICIELGLESEESAEYIVAKAIRDGVIEATLDHEKGFMKSKEIGDIYATREPGEAFHERIQACLGLHDESVKVFSSRLLTPKLY
jgi:26S proteasome regulatory subunit N3